MAIAPEQIGIGIHRHFTRPETHPYDMVEWERREARITNYKDGTDAFFQPDVEFPASWSQNATNIVAQKYFRGTLGTPERETSLKQVIDRIADTITAWGVRDGYFVDDHEGAAFRDELKYLLLSQRAAFNSPVWFNIGVKGVPQQASACQPYDALVSTPEGLVPIGKLVEDRAVGAKVFDARGITKVVAVKANGRKQVLRVHTKAGLTLDVTPDHLVWRARTDAASEFVEAGELRPGDRLEWHRIELGAAVDVTEVEIERIDSLGEMDVYDIQTESGEYLSNDLRVHNCFILAVEDTMDGILNWYREEGTIFKGGSGSGINLSGIRSSLENLKGGGTASGPVSFMRGADASAGTIKSGGKTRRAAKMVILNADHPDVEEFIWCKAIEERKARALADAGFDMDLDGRDSHSIQYQNANNSVRVTDAFMQAVLDDKDWDLIGVTTGEPLRRVRARDLMRQISESAWECADPGMQFDTTINRWHTAPNTARINGSNPCFPGSARVHTDKGLIRFAELVDRARQGEAFGIYTHDATNSERPAERLEVTRPEAVMITGFNEIVKLTFSNGSELRCTPGHKIFTTNRGFVVAAELTPDDRVKALDLPAPASAADARIAAAHRLYAVAGRGDKKSLEFNLPEKWTEEFAHYLGWLVGDGCISSDKVTTIYGNDEEQQLLLPRHRELAAWMNGGRASKPSIQANGTIQLRQTRRVIARFFRALGVSTSKSGEKVVPEAVFQAPQDAVAAFLRGLFDADGCVYDGDKSRYVGLGSVSHRLLVGVQQLLTTFGIHSSIYETRRPRIAFTYTRRDGSEALYEGSQLYDLRISARSVARFAESIGFELPSKATKLARMVSAHRFYDTDTTVHLEERTDDGVELTFNLSEPRNHSYIVDGTVVRNCSEYMHIDNSACNLASINLLHYLDDDGNFDVPAFEHTVEVMFTAQEILVGNADYPTEPIAENSRKFRQLGLGYANLGALLMAQGLPYDSDEGRAWAAAITALMTGHSYATSARTAGRMGPFAGYAENAEPMLDVLRMHRTEASKINEDLVPPELLGAAQRAWDDAVETGEQFGVRNSQATVLAPTGCLVGGTLVPTERGLVRLGSLGDPVGEQWQPLGVDVQTDEGAREATQFYVNGVEPVVDVRTACGYSLRGTAKHRVKIVDASGEWVWRRLADLRTGDRVPLALDQLVGGPNEVLLPPLAEAHWTRELRARVPRVMTPELAELVGYFMGDGSLHSKGLRFCVSAGDFDVVDHLAVLGKELFGLEAAVAEKRGYTEVAFHSVRLALWWEACGFAKLVPHEGHSGKGYVPHVPEAVLHTNDREAYAAFLRGLFEADGTVTARIPTWVTAKASFADEVQSLLLALGYPTTAKHDVSGHGSALTSLRLLNSSYHTRWLGEVGFISGRKSAGVVLGANEPSTERYFYDEVVSAELGDEELTYDLSVPSNVTYIANGFVSHNTIGLMMDCDTTGVEPDLALTKAKKLVGGGTMFIVNQTIPRALRNLGYSDEEVDAIIAHIDEHKSIVGAPGFNPEHLPVFACSMGDNTIHYMGHVTMMGAVQPFISGAISKCVVGDTLITTADGLVRIGSLHRGEAPDSFRDEIIEVASLGGARKTDAFYYGGHREVREATLRSGHRIVGTPNHRLLVAGQGQLEWMALEDVLPGEYVAVQYGDEMWATLPARLDDFVPSPSYGSQKAVRIPPEMTEDLAFLLGAYASEGHTTRSTYTISITNSVDGVLEKVAAAWRSVFGIDAKIVRPTDRCPAVLVSSKTVVELFEHLGCGARASAKRIPDAVLRSPREMVLAFLQGLALDAYTTTWGRNAKWAICLDSPGMLDDLQAVLTNLGVVHGRITKHNRDNDKTYDEVYVTGEQAQRLVALVPFLEPDKSARAAELAALDRTSRHNTADVVPGILPRDLYELLPKAPGRGGAGMGVRSEFAFLCDDRTRHISRRTLERVAAVAGVTLPEWLQVVLRDNLHFSPVESVRRPDPREVFDVSVPTTHAFVGNGIVNHNTVNMPEDVTVEDVEQLHIDAWKLGVKAIAIYRDNCKVAQPLATQKKASDSADEPAEVVERIVEHVIVQEPVRQKLPRTRNSKTFSFRVADCRGFATVAEYEDGRPGELFLNVSKQGSTLAGLMDSFAISVSHGLQYGVPLRAFVETFSNRKFEPAGMTDDPDIRIAQSLVDYIFRKLAVLYLPYEERVEIGVLTTGERTQPTLPGVEESMVVDEPTSAQLPPEDQAPSASVSQPTLPTVTPSVPQMPQKPTSAKHEVVLCHVCGDIMQRAGSCHACPSCGATSGCS